MRTIDRCIVAVALLVSAEAKAVLPAPRDGEVQTLSGFRTFNGKPLVELLHSYGIHIASVYAQPADLGRPAADRTDVVIYTISFSSGPTSKMPCRLNEWMKADPLPQSEFERRGRAFPKINAASDDPLIYWAATGKCSKAYEF